MNDNYNEKIAFLSLNQLSILLIGSVLSLTKNPVVSIIGYTMCLIIIFNFFIHFIANKNYLSVMSITFLIIFYLFIVLSKNISTRAVVEYLQISSLVMMVSVMLSISLDDEIFNGVRNIFLFFLLILIPFFLCVYYFGLYEILSTNYISFTVLKALFALSIFGFILCRHKLVYVFLISSFFFLLGERTACGTILLIYVFDKILPRLSKKFFTLVFFMSSIFVVLVPKIYVYFSAHPLGILINALSMQYTKGNFFSGRQLIWSIAYDSLQGHEWFGLSFANNILRISGIDLSTHNLFIYIQLVGGYMFLILFLSFLCLIWLRYYEHIDDPIVCASAAYLLGFMILSSFELLWLVNNFAVSLCMWFVVGVGLMRANFLESKITQLEINA